MQTTQTEREAAPGSAASIRTLQVLTHLVFGGTEFYVLRQLRKSDRSAFEHTVCYLSPKEDLKDKYDEAGIRTICLHHRGPATAARTILRLVRLIRKLKIDVVHTHSRSDRLYGQIAAALCGVPVVNTLHSMYVAERYRPTRDQLEKTLQPVAAFRLFIEDWLERRTVQHVIAVSDEVKRTWASHPDAALVASGRLSVVNAGVEFNLFQRSRGDAGASAVGRELGLENAFPVLANVARLQPGKGQTMLVPVMKAVLTRWPRARAVIVGEGPERPNLEATIREADLEGCIHLAGARTDIPDVLAASDVFVFPSLSEGFGVAVLEAVAAAKPVVAFALPPLETLFQPPMSAVLVETGNVEQLTAATLDVLEHLEAARESARSTRAYARERYDAGAAARKLENIYREVVLSMPAGRGRS